MRMFDILIGLWFMSIFISILGLYLPLAQYNIYPDTIHLAQQMLNNTTSRIQSYTSNESTNNNGLQQIIDFLGMVQVQMLGVFNYLTHMPVLLSTFMYETLNLLGLNMLDQQTTRMVSEFLTIVAFTYIAIVVIEWIRPGFTRMV